MKRAVALAVVAIAAIFGIGVMTAGGQDSWRAASCSSAPAATLAPADGASDPGVVGALGALRLPGWSRMRLPDAARGGLAKAGVAAAYIDQARLWSASQDVAYWVVAVPTLGDDGCPGKGGPGACVVAVNGTRALGVLCATREQLSRLRGTVIADGPRR